MRAAAPVVDTATAWEKWLMRVAATALGALLIMAGVAFAQAGRPPQAVAPSGTMYNGNNAQLQPLATGSGPAGQGRQAATGGPSPFGNAGSNAATGTGAAGASGGGNVVGGEH